MSNTASYSVAVVGGTGGLGVHISHAFLTDFRSSFHTVRILTRDTSSATAQELSAKGAKLHKLDESDLPRTLDEAFEGIDVIVNVLAGQGPDEVKQAVLDAAARSDVKVYFLNEFGSDHKINDFPGYEHPGWLGKQKAATETRKVLSGRKVIALYPSLFLEFATTVMGIDLEKNTYLCYGSPNQKLSVTARVDIGRAVARLAILALAPDTASKVPDEVRIAGATTTYEEIRDTVARAKGVPKAEITVKDLKQLKDSIRRDPGKNFFDYLNVVVGEGKADFSSGNANDLVNPGETYWKWKTVEDHVRSL
ncbi:NAD-P-binding protein [Cubamyces sp. BRFM 1775]|nr:NAD-P-binding protein [Cubamyces sp. BRFM 1775]